MSKHMKIFLNVISWILILALFLSALLFWAMGSNAEEATAEKPHFVYAAYVPGEGVSGFVEVPDSFRRCYVVAKFFTCNSVYVPVLMTIGKNGEFSCDENTEAKYVTLWIVDNDFVFEDGLFCIYDMWEMNWGLYKPPDSKYCLILTMRGDGDAAD